MTNRPRKTVNLLPEAKAAIAELQKMPEFEKKSVSYIINFLAIKGLEAVREAEDVE